MMPTLVYKTPKQRFYKVDFPIKYGKSFDKDVDVQKEFNEDFEKMTPKNKEILKNYKFDIVCISDATTHVERLVFLGAELPSGEYSRLNTQIDGKYTFMIYGGDYNSVYDDKVYLRHLKYLNSKVVYDDKERND